MEEPLKDTAVQDSEPVVLTVEEDPIFFLLYSIPGKNPHRKRSTIDVTERSKEGITNTSIGLLFLWGPVSWDTVFKESDGSSSTVNTTGSESWTAVSFSGSSIGSFFISTACSVSFLSSCFVVLSPDDISFVFASIGRVFISGAAAVDVALLLMDLERQWDRMFIRGCQQFFRVVCYCRRLWCRGSLLDKGFGCSFHGTPIVCCKANGADTYGNTRDNANDMLWDETFPVSPCTWQQVVRLRCFLFQFF